MSDKEKKVKIIWDDIKVFSSKNKNIEISVMETIGFVEAEYDDYILVKDPITINTKTGKKHPEKNPTFYLIPKNLIEKIVDLT